jgi:mono/diheme cytochrome c family protein
VSLILGAAKRGFYHSELTYTGEATMSDGFLRHGVRVGILTAFFGVALVVSTARAQDAALIAKGDSLFNGNRLGACWACHGKKGVGTSNGPKLNDKEWLHIPGPDAEAIKGIITNGVPKPKKAKTAMPAMGGAKLTPDQIDALAAYVVSLSAGAKK